MRVSKIRKITLDTPVKVYDIEVPLTSNFCLSNGCVVHNSKDIADACSGLTKSILNDLEKFQGVSQIYALEKSKQIYQELYRGHPEVKELEHKITSIYG